MKLGIYLNAQHPAGDDPARRLAETLEQARLIRSLGFDSIWGGEHHVTPGFHYFPLLPLHNPVELAEIGAFLDVITGGRFMLGVGLGYRTEDRVTHHGRHWQFDDVSIHPRPLQQPRPPSGHVCRLLEVVCAPDEETAVRRAAPFLLEKYEAYLSWGLAGITLDPAAKPEDQMRRLAANRFALGSPKQVVEALLAQHKAGVTHATMRVSWPGMRQDDILVGIELLEREVVPEVRRRTAAGLA